MDNEEADEVLAPAYKSKMRYQDVTKPYFDQVKDQDDLHKKLFLDMHLWLPHDILLKADKMTMAHSLELRVPYLEQKSLGTRPQHRQQILRRRHGNKKSLPYLRPLPHPNGLGKT